MFDILDSEAIKTPLTARREIIKVIAVGGGGGNALNYIISNGVEHVEFLAFNTDLTDLNKSLADKKLVLGEKVTKGLGAGSNPAVGEEAAKESTDKIKEFIKGADMVYITAGMGGGTGTGAAPIVAKIAKDMGILTVAVVTRPFFFEGKRKMRLAQEGIEKLSETVDAMIVISNEKLFDVTDANTSVAASFAKPNEVLRQAVQGVTDLVTKPGTINVDFADLKAVMTSSGYAVMGVGKGKGENKMMVALEKALSSPLMESPAGQAKGILMNISGGKDICMGEVTQIANYVDELISEEATFVWGLVEEEGRENEVEVTIIATGFDLQSVVKEGAKQVAQHIKPSRTAHVDAPYKPLYHQTAREAAAPAVNIPSVNLSSVTPEQPVYAEPRRYEPRAQEPRYHAAPQPVPSATGPDWLCHREEEQAKQNDVINWDEPTFTRQGKNLRLQDRE